jgi:fatty acid desaturase (delta-4 desaturase)
MNIKETDVILHDDIYDLKEFSKVHPGGANILNIFGGKNATIHYYMLHPHIDMRKSLLDKYKIGSVNKILTTNDVTKTYLINSEPYKILKRRVNSIIKYPYATTEWYIKAFFIMSSITYLEYTNMFYGFTITRSILLGIFMALVGLCIQHDANHGAVSANEKINMFWGLTQDWIGGSSILWKHHHVLLHHAYTNNYEEDPDITTDIIRLHKYVKWNKIYVFQKIYIWFLLSLLPINWHILEIKDLYSMKHMGENISKMATNESRVGLLLRFMFIIRFYIIPIYLHPSIFTILNILLTLVVGGLYLGLNFIISHNFEGVKKIIYENTSYRKDWALLQAETSSTVGGRVLGFFHGGLNYQIEHHLFPRISHVHYHKIKPIVEEWCRENKIKYNYYNNLYSNVKSCYKHLEGLGESD